MKRVAILQSNYIPWKGYFDIIRQVDLFIFYDDMQYTKNDWRNRNIIKTPRGGEWLTIPCGPCWRQTIDQVVVDNKPWQREHWAKITAHYQVAPYWRDYRDFFADIYLGQTWHRLSDLNRHIIRRLCREVFGFGTAFEDSSRFGFATRKTDKLIDLLRAVGATHYLSGPTARSYLEEERFLDAGIVLEYMDYSSYPEYAQLHGGPFLHQVSAIDLVFNTGPRAADHLVRRASA